VAAGNFASRRFAAPAGRRHGRAARPPAAWPVAGRWTRPNSRR